jgi:hypothetical protein
MPFGVRRCEPSRCEIEPRGRLGHQGVAAARPFRRRQGEELRAGADGGLPLGPPSDARTPCAPRRWRGSIRGVPLRPPRGLPSIGQARYTASVLRRGARMAERQPYRGLACEPGDPGAQCPRGTRPRSEWIATIGVSSALSTASRRLRAGGTDVPAAERERRGSQVAAPAPRHRSAITPGPARKAESEGVRVRDVPGRTVRRSASGAVFYRSEGSTSIGRTTLANMASR